ncbi:MAG TPA: hypothetical protein VFN21_01830 [Acidimicrobiales bacterium]|nr:hypothetical protein [Acidimicrobiales bacterium]
MKSPSSVRVRVDAQGRMVLPRGMREDVVTPPGEVLVRRTPEGLVLSQIPSEGNAEIGSDGLPVLHLGRRVTNEEVLDALDRERAER